MIPFTPTPSLHIKSTEYNPNNQKEWRHSLCSFDGGGKCTDSQPEGDASDAQQHQDEKEKHEANGIVIEGCQPVQDTGKHEGGKHVEGQFCYELGEEVRHCVVGVSRSLSKREGRKE